MKPTKEQAAVIADIVGGKSIAVEATAGSGKSTTLIQAVVKLIKKHPNHGKGRGLIVVFNVKVAADLNDKLAKALGYKPEGWEVRTFNSLGLGTLLANGYGKASKGLDVNDRKNRMIVDHMLESARGKKALASCLTGKFAARASHFLHSAADILVETLAVCKTHGVIGAQFKGDNAARILEIATENVGFEAMLKPSPMMQRIVTSCLQYNLELAKKDGIIDFADQIYLAILECKHIGRRWETVIMDECQDANWLGVAQVSRACRRQLVLVGDKNQVLFDSLRGADYGLITKLIKERKMPTRELTVTFRCPRTVALRQIENGPLKRFTPVDGAKPGDIRYPFFKRKFVTTPTGGKTEVKYWSFNTLADTLEHHVAGFKKTDSLGLIASTNADLVATMAFLCGENGKTLDELNIFYRGVRFPVTFWRRAATLRYGEGGSAAMFAAKFYMAVTGATPDQACGQFMTAGDLSRSDALLSAGSVHTLKGLEFDHVLIINGQSFYGKVPVRYVAETRTKNSLFGAKLACHDSMFSPMKFSKAARLYIAYRKRDQNNVPVVSPKVAFSTALNNVPETFRAQLPSNGPKDTASASLVKADPDVKKNNRPVVRPRRGELRVHRPALRPKKNS